MTDLAAYLRRIEYTGSTDTTIDTLRALVAAHNGAIPFENLDPLMGIPVVDLGRAALFDKLVQRRRGGYCYEQNGVMGYVLAELGFGVQRLRRQDAAIRLQSTILRGRPKPRPMGRLLRQCQFALMKRRSTGTSPVAVRVWY